MEYEEYKQRRRGRLTGLIGSVLTVLYAIYIMSYFGGIFMETLGGFLASALVMPHMVCVVLAAVFSCVGFFARKRWATLTSAILLTVAATLFLKYAPFVVVQAVLLFVSYVRMSTPATPGGEWRKDPDIPALKAAYIIPIVLFVLLWVLLADMSGG